MKKIFIMILLLLFCSVCNAETVRKVNLYFAGKKECPEEQIEQARVTYNQWATQYNLQKRGFDIIDHIEVGQSVIDGVLFKYAKFDVLESNLYDFLTTWYGIIESVGAERLLMKIEFYTVEE